jgi:hypothetical protein
MDENSVRTGPPTWLLRAGDRIDGPGVTRSSPGGCSSVTVTLDPPEGRARALSGPSPDLSPASCIFQLACQRLT